jgi:phosphatidylinositol dimannoside acyltransferase
VTDARPKRRRGTAGQEARALAVRGVSWLAGRLPEGPLIRLTELGGSLWYRVAPDRAAQARRNLRRVARSLDERGLGSREVRAAARDPRALERLVRAAFRHNARYYLEVARGPSLQRRDVAERILIETPETVAEAFDSGNPVIFVGLHFGDLELPARLLAAHVGQAVAPMETIGDPALQAYFERTRGAAGIRIVGLREARRELLNALRDRVSVGLVGDRDLTGGGAQIELFGAPATLPLGPALLSIESGARMYVVGVRRAGTGRYRGRLEPIPMPPDGPRRERVMVATAAVAAAFERIVADAPEQWWAVFFPIWPDLEAAAQPTATSTDTNASEPPPVATGSETKGRTA